MALQISLGRGLVRSAYDPATLPSLSELNAKQKQDFQTSFGQIDLSSATLAQFNAFKTAALAAQAQNNFENFAPFKGSMVRVYAASSGDYPLTWAFGGKLYALTSDGLKSMGIEDTIATID